MKYLFVINPIAGHRKAKEIKEILDKKFSKDKKYKNFEHAIIVPASIKEHDEKIQRKIEKEGFLNIVAVGGDGTIAQIAKVISNYSNTNLGIIPHGTGNILASNLGIPNDIDVALNILFNGKIKHIDLGKVDKYPFTIIAGTGVPAGIIENIKQEEKMLFGVWAYFIKGLEHLYNAKEFSFEINIDGKIIKRKSIAVFVCNAGNFLGPLPTITPQAEPTDGYLDVFIVSLKSLQENPIEYFELLINYLTRNLESNGKMESFKGKSITINSEAKLKVQADGDIVSETPTKIEILPEKLSVIVPAKPQILHPSISNILEKIQEIF